MKNLESDFLLQDYIKTIIYRDIADRYSIRNTHVLKFLINRCVQNFAGTFSIHKFYNQLKSQQIKTSKDTLYQYVTYLEEALFIFRLPKKIYSYSKQEKELKKLYLCDLIIEIISPATAQRDLHEKFHLYQQSGVREYWIAFPNEQILTVYELQTNGRYDDGITYSYKNKVKVRIFDDLEIDLQKIFN